MKLTASIKERPVIGWLIFFVIMLAVFLLGMLAASITERRAETTASVFNNRKVEITGIEPRNRIWGQNFPREFETWKRTANMDFRSKHMGNMPEDVLSSRPNMVVLWAGYAFAKDYSAPRGHMYALEDQYVSMRTGTPRNPEDGPQPGTCWACKSPDVPRLMEEMGIANFYSAKWGALGAEVVNPIGCGDCHDPVTMSLTITRPALVEAFHRQGRDITQATNQEMRSLVCAQCHVEYYFQGDGKYLTFPWDGGMTVEAMEAYYDAAKYSDWTHSISKAPMLKAQHPDYELFLLGPHGQRGLACADCHLPYVSEGGVKYSNHQIMSPLNNISGTCGTCHRDSEANLRMYVEQNQDKVLEIRDRLEPELVRAHIMAKAAWDAGATAEEMAPALQLIREAGWRWDYGVASHGASFHAPVETQRILAHGLDRALQAQIALQQVLFAHGVTDVPMPDLSTRAAASAYIGFDIEKERAANEEWLKTVIPQWLETAKQNGRL